MMNKNNIYQIFKKYLVLIALLSVIISVFLYANYYRLNLDYKPYNGAFQTFNPIERIFRGEIPGQDFNPYLGLGTTYFNTFITYLLGGTFAASQFGTHFSALMLHFIVLIVLFFLSGFSLRKSIISSSVLVIILSFIVKKVYILEEIAGPGTSNLSIRSFLPFFTSIIVFFYFN